MSPLPPAGSYFFTHANGGPQRAKTHSGNCPDAARYTCPRMKPKIVLGAGCESQGPEVVVYAAQDRVVAEPILTEFERVAGVRARAERIVRRVPPLDSETPDCD